MNTRLSGKNFAAGVIGNVLEWYDFAIYGYFAASIGRNFFPLGERRPSCFRQKVNLDDDQTTGFCFLCDNQQIPPLGGGLCSLRCSLV